MKCAKCGFISFDYLTLCKKCGTNLNPARNGLGFSDVEPAPPPYLRALVESEGAIEPAVAQEQSTSAGRTTFRMEQPDSEAPAPARVSPQVQEVAGGTVEMAEPVDEWTVDPKWLEEFDKKPLADMPEVDDLILELVDDDIPARADAAGPSDTMTFERDFPAMDDIAEDDDMFMGLEDNKSPASVSPAGPLGGTELKQPVPPHEGMPDIDDLFLELVGDEASGLGNSAAGSGAMDSDRTRLPLDVKADESLDDLVFEELSPGADMDLSLGDIGDELELISQPAGKATAPRNDFGTDLDDIVLELDEDTLDLEEMELEGSSTGR